MDKVIEYLKNLPEEKWETKVNSTWDVKDVVAHLIAWNYEAAREIKRLSEEGGQAWFLNTGRNFDEFNAKAVEKYGGLSKNELISELKRSDKEVDKIVEKIGRENLENRSGFKWLFDKEDRKPHSVQHLDKIKEVLGE